MSPRSATATALLDALEAWGEEPVVAPVKLVDGHRPAVEPSRFDHGPWLALTVLATFVVLWAITVAWIWWGGAGPSFIYAEF